MATKKHLRIIITDPYIEGIDLLIKDGLYETQSEILKDALRRLFVHYQIPCITDHCNEKLTVA